MIDYAKGENLIFLISQPRAGSTLTQRILGSHPDIHTQSEPWVMLHPMYALKPQGLQAAFDSGLYATALRDFIGSLPGGEAQYRNSIALAYSSFYNSILEKHNKKYFLDKTPRYYHIIPELSEYFPESKFIFLWRNPAAVVSSVLLSWVNTNWHNLTLYKEDLLKAPHLILEGMSLLGDRAWVLHYEKLVSEPEKITKDLCGFLGLDYNPTMINYGESEKPSWNLGDSGKAINSNQPDPSHIEKWKVILKHPQAWRIVSEYISGLGREVIVKMGYDFDSIHDEILAHKPNANLGLTTLPFYLLADNSRDAIRESRELQYKLNYYLNEVKMKDELLNQRASLMKQKDEQIKHLELMLKQKEEKLQAAKKLLNKSRHNFDEDTH